MSGQSDQLSLFHVDESGDVGFERLSQENGIRYWFARDYMRALGYEDWSGFKKKVLNRALAACAVLGISIEENFSQCQRAINGRKVDDYKLTRFSCCIIALNGDPKNKIVAEAQAYFSSLALWVQNEAFAPESADRIITRQEISEREITLNSTAARCGVTSFPDFQNAGYRGMYNMNLWELKRLRGMEGMKRSMLDFMGKDELAGNLFRLSLTEGRLKNQMARGQSEAEYIAEDVGRGVRQMMIDQTGTSPESLPLGDDINLVKRGLKIASKELLAGDDIESQRAHRAAAEIDIMLSMPVDGFFPDCKECQSGGKTSHNGSAQCSSGSIASGGTVSHCDCDYCSPA